jgi:hypothetical protein
LPTCWVAAAEVAAAVPLEIFLRGAVLLAASAAAPLGAAVLAEAGKSIPFLAKLGGTRPLE